MRKMGLEPTRYCYHRHLKPARLPIPPLLLISFSHFLSLFQRWDLILASRLGRCCCFATSSTGRPHPTRYCYHRHLKPARLPIPPLLRTNAILMVFPFYVNAFSQKRAPFGARFYPIIFLAKLLALSKSSAFGLPL